MGAKTTTRDSFVACILSGVLPGLLFHAWCLIIFSLALRTPPPFILAKRTALFLGMLAVGPGGALLLFLSPGRDLPELSVALSAAVYGILGGISSLTMRYLGVRGQMSDKLLLGIGALLLISEAIAFTLAIKNLSSPPVPWYSLK